MDEELNWGCVPSDFAEQQAMRQVIEMGTWISASEARDIVSQGWQEDGKPTEAICRRARQGYVQAVAWRWVTIEKGQRYEKRNHLIERGFWDDCDMDQNWSHGEFKSTIYPNDAKFEIEAFGVTFERSDIEAISPPSSANAFAPNLQLGRPKGSGGYAT